MTPTMKRKYKVDDCKHAALAAIAEGKSPGFAAVTGLLYKRSIKPGDVDDLFGAIREVFEYRGYWNRSTKSPEWRNHGYLWRCGSNEYDLIAFVNQYFDKDQLRRYDEISRKDKLRKFVNSYLQLYDPAAAAATRKRTRGVARQRWKKRRPSRVRFAATARQMETKRRNMVSKEVREASEAFRRFMNSADASNDPYLAAGRPNAGRPRNMNEEDRIIMNDTSVPTDKGPVESNEAIGIYEV